MATKYVSRLNTVIKVGEIYIDHFPFILGTSPAFLILDIYKRGRSKICTIKVQAMRSGYIAEYPASRFANCHKKV